MEQAECAKPEHRHTRNNGVPDKWFPERNAIEDGLNAQKVCIQCPVRKQCRQLYNESKSTDGIWAGKRADPTE